MSSNIVFSAYAVETYDSILAQILYRWGNNVADDFEQRVIKVLDTIEHSPLIFQVIKDNRISVNVLFMATVPCFMR